MVMVMFLFSKQKKKQEEATLFSLKGCKSFVSRTFIEPKNEKNK